MDLSDEFILFSCASDANVIVVIVFIVVVFDTSSQVEDHSVKKISKISNALLIVPSVKVFCFYCKFYRATNRRGMCAALECYETTAPAAVTPIN